LLLIPAILAGYSAMATSVTFRVDMSLQTVPPEGVHIAGSFQGWNPGGTPMTLTGNNIYEYTAVLVAGETVEYKYINGDEWGEDESVPPACAQNNNRFLTVPSNDTILPAVCFGSCGPCGAPVSITFKVDLSEQSVSPDGVHIAGSFQGWNPGSSPMTDMGNGVYAYSVTLSAGDYVEYKFINGNDWPGEENVPAACGVPNGVGGYNRFLDVPNANTTINTVCFGSCFPCGYVPVPVDITFVVDMSEQTVSAEGVHIAGSFQGWEPGSTELTSVGSGTYAVTLTLLSGEYHEYKFINGNTWDSVELVPPECGHDDGQGGYNRFFTVPETDSSLLAVCFNSCESCSIIGIQEFLNESVLSLSVTPNPFSAEATVGFFVPGKGNIAIRLFNSMGVCVMQITEPVAEKGRKTRMIGNESLPSGVYFVNVMYSGDVSISNATVPVVVK